MRSPLGTLLNKTPVPYVSSQRRASMIMPATTQNDPASQMGAMGSVGTLFAIVHRLSNAVAQVDWHLYRKAKSGKPEDRVEVTSHAALDLWNRPNPFTANQEFLEASQQHLDLTGEAWWVIARSGSSSLPLELWTARPDRMQPVPHPTDFISGYVYTGPAGEVVPLGLDDVIQLRMPNPLDPYRGMGPVQAVLADLDASRYSAEWNRNFFLNSAEPGGIIEVDRHLSDSEFDELRMRWSEQHRGVANAHRVAILEAGKWVDRKFSHNEMQFAQIRKINSEVIREAFGIAGFAIGDIKDVNRATADASAAWFAAQMMVPRLERIKWALNYLLLPLYGRGTEQTLEFDYDNPVLSDRETDTAQLTAMAKAANLLVAVGYDPAGVLEAVGLPEIGYVGVPAAVAPEAPAAPAVGPATPSRRAVAELADGHSHPPDMADPFNCVACRPAWLNAAADDDDETSAERTREDWQDRVDQLVGDWVAHVSPGQTDALVGAVERIVESGSPEDLAGIEAPTDDAVKLLTGHMFDQATAAAHRIAEDAAAHGVSIAPAVPVEPAKNMAPALVARVRPKPVKVVAGLAGDLVAAAKVTASNLAKALAAAAAREALRAWHPGATGKDVSGRVRDYLEGLTTATLGTELSAAIWAAENEGRFATYGEAEADGTAPTAYVASEIRDDAQCGPCADVDGTVYTSLADAQADYPFGAYRDCDGRNRCRGTVEPQWSDE